ncbi:MAG: heme-copper oxidase subunit III [Chloroflexi bacterium]|nr:heme-copper oxidase subunit III [Chloroflexota bacterium]
MQGDLAERRLTPKEELDLKNKRTGLAIFQVSWIMVFICMMVVHWQIRAQSPTWPPEGVERLGIVAPTAMTLALIFSSLLARRADRALKAGQTEIFLWNWRMTIALGVLFVLVMGFEWLTVPISGQYSNLFRVLVGFHGVHALVIGALLVRVYRSALKGVYHSGNFWPVEGAAGLWYFVTIAWILFYVVLYWS